MLMESNLRGGNNEGCCGLYEIDESNVEKIEEAPLG